MAITKKRAFERWVERALRRRERQELNERRRFDRDRLLRDWSEWIALPTTRRALLPISLALVLSAAGGWWFGSQRPCQPQLVAPGVPPALAP